MGGDDDSRRRVAGEPSDQRDQVVLARPVHAAGRLVERDQPGQLLALHPSGERDRQRQPLPLAAGEVARVGVDRVLQADDAQAPPAPSSPGSSSPTRSRTR